MKTEVKEAIEFLEAKGYKYDDHWSNSFDTHSLYKRMTGSHCQTNERPPNFTFEIYENSWGGSCKVGIRAEAVNKQWVDFNFYGMSLDQVKNFAEFEYSLSKAWEAVN